MNEPVDKLALLYGIAQIEIGPAIAYKPEYIRHGLAQFPGRITYLYDNIMIRSAQGTLDCPETPPPEEMAKMENFFYSSVSFEHAERSYSGARLVCTFTRAAFQEESSETESPSDFWGLLMGSNGTQMTPLLITSGGMPIGYFDMAGTNLIVLRPRENQSSIILDLQLVSIDLALTPPVGKVIVDRVGSNSFNCPTWSHDNKYVYFFNMEQDSESLQYKGSICRLNIDNDECTVLVQDSHNNTHPRCSPNGQELAYVSDNTLVVHDLYTGVRVVLDTPNPVEQSQIAWSPDGQFLLVPLQIEQHSTDLFMTDRNGRRIERITNLGYCHCPSWSLN